MNKYDVVWNQLKQTGQADLTVSKAAERRILNGIKLAKTTENVARRQVGLMGWSKLVIERKEISDTHVKISLSFLYSTAL